MIQQKLSVTIKWNNNQVASTLRTTKCLEESSLQTTPQLAGSSSVGGWGLFPLPSIFSQTACELSERDVIQDHIYLGERVLSYTGTGCFYRQINDVVLVCWLFLWVNVIHEESFMFNSMLFTLLPAVNIGCQYLGLEWCVVFCQP